VGQKQAYRIELVGVTCDTGLAVARGIWRKIRTGRSVPVHSQLRSHRLFAENFEDFASVVDSATLYHTGELPDQSEMCVMFPIVWIS
jgi:copper homeostasis protein CutC